MYQTKTRFPFLVKCRITLARMIETNTIINFGTIATQAAAYNRSDIYAILKTFQDNGLINDDETINVEAARAWMEKTKK